MPRPAISTSSARLVQSLRSARPHQSPTPSSGLSITERTCSISASVRWLLHRCSRPRYSTRARTTSCHSARSETRARRPLIIRRASRNVSPSRPRTGATNARAIRTQDPKSRSAPPVEMRDHSRRTVSFSRAGVRAIGLMHLPQGRR